MERQNQKVRVLVAAEYPKVRDLLTELAREEPEIVIVGQAENSTKAITLARSLRPDIALLDCHLPQTVGIDPVRLSRIGGLDAALVIYEEVQTTRAIVLSNLDEAIVRGDGPASEVTLCREVGRNTIAFTLRQLYQESVTPTGPIFARVEPCEKRSLRQKVIQVSERAIFYGGLGILAGLCLMVTVLFAPSGALMALVGLGVVLSGIAGRLGALLLPRASLPLGEYRLLEGNKVTHDPLIHKIKKGTSGKA